MAAMGERDGQPNFGTDAFIDLTSAPLRPRPPAHTVYDDVRRVLLDRGLTRGRERNRRGQLGLIGAIESAVSAADPVCHGRPSDGARLARKARIARHLRELAGASNLGSWVDARGRSVGDVLDLLTLAAVAYPDD